jgi:hypothetical protein
MVYWTRFASIAMPKSIFEFIKEARDRYRSDTVTVADGYEFSQYETLRTIELYSNSTFTSGNMDSLDREKPFFNICKFRVIATRATHLDTKDVTIQSEGFGVRSYAQSFRLTLKNRNWMKAQTSRNFPTRWATPVPSLAAPWSRRRSAATRSNRMWFRGRISSRTRPTSRTA